MIGVLYQRQLRSRQTSLVPATQASTRTLTDKFQNVPLSMMRRERGCGVMLLLSLSHISEAGPRRYAMPYRERRTRPATL